MEKYVGISFCRIPAVMFYEQRRERALVNQARNAFHLHYAPVILCTASSYRNLVLVTISSGRVGGGGFLFQVRVER